MKYKNVSGLVLEAFVITLRAFQIKSKKNESDASENFTMPHRKSGNTGLSVSEWGFGLGSCAKQCPFSVPVRKNMKEMEKIFGE